MGGACTFLLYAPQSEAAGTTREVLASVGLQVEELGTFDALLVGIERTLLAGVIFHDADLGAADWTRLAQALRAQPAWSDLPIVCLVSDQPQTSLVSTSHLGNVTLVDVNAPRAAILFAVRTALRSRQRQYQIRQLLQNKDDLVAEKEQLLGALAATDRRKNEFIAMLGHELRNPLAAIANTLPLLDVDRSTETLEWALPLIRRQSQNLGRLVGDLLDVALLSWDQLRIDRAPLDLRVIGKRCCEAFHAQANAKQQHLECSAPADDELLVDGDAVRLEQLLGNLIANAIAHTSDQGRITVRLERSGGDVVMRVHDEGPGIPPAILATVFQPFTQDRQGIDRAKGGLGLGLPLAKRLAELHGGSISVTTETGRGSELVVRLPALIAKPAVVVPAPVATPAKAKTPSLRIVVIDDNDDVRETLIDVLKRWGHTVIGAVDGISGVDAIAREQPEVALVDIGLPGIDGYEVARQTRATQAPDQRLLLVAVTGYGSRDDRQRALAAGFDIHLVKPLNVKELSRILANWNLERVDETQVVTG